MKGLTDKDIQQGVDEAESKLGVNYDKNAAWDKLQMRMNAPVKKMGYYYRLAAAVLLVFLCVSFFVRQYLHSNTDALTTVPHQTAITTSPHPSAIPNIVVPAKRAIAKAIKKQKSSIAPVVTNSITTKEPENAMPIEAASIPAPETVIAVTKTKLKVVHINDVYDEPIPFRSEKQDIFLTIISPEVLRKHTKALLTQSSNNKTIILNTKN